MTRRTYVERASSPAVYRGLFEESFGPLIALRGALSDRPDGSAALDRDFAAFTEQANVSAPGGPAEYVYDYLLVLARARC